MFQWFFLLPPLPSFPDHYFLPDLIGVFQWHCFIDCVFRQICYALKKIRPALPTVTDLGDAVESESELENAYSTIIRACLI